MSDPAARSEFGGAPAGVAVRLRGVTKSYPNGTAALGPLDLDVRSGEFVSLLGPSGCGKSTALRLIAGLAAPSSGAVQLQRRAPELRGKHPIGFVFQEPTLMPWTSVRGNVGLPLQLAHVPRAEIEARVSAALARVELDAIRQAPPA